MAASSESVQEGDDTNYGYFLIQVFERGAYRVRDCRPLQRDPARETFLVVRGLRPGIDPAADTNVPLPTYECTNWFAYTTHNYRPGDRFTESRELMVSINQLKLDDLMIEYFDRIHNRNRLQKDLLLGSSTVFAHNIWRWSRQPPHILQQTKVRLVNPVFYLDEVGAILDTHDVNVLKQACDMLEVAYAPGGPSMVQCHILLQRYPSRGRSGTRERLENIVQSSTSVDRPITLVTSADLSYLYLKVGFAALLEAHDDRIVQALAEQHNLGESSIDPFDDLRPLISASDISALDERRMQYIPQLLRTMSSFDLEFEVLNNIEHKMTTGSQVLQAGDVVDYNTQNLNVPKRRRIDFDRWQPTGGDSEKSLDWSSTEDRLLGRRTPNISVSTPGSSTTSTTRTALADTTPTVVQSTIVADRTVTQTLSAGATRTRISDTTPTIVQSTIVADRTVTQALSTETTRTQVPTTVAVTPGFRLSSPPITPPRRETQMIPPSTHRRPPKASATLKRRRAYVDKEVDVDLGRQFEQISVSPMRSLVPAPRRSEVGRDPEAIFVRQVRERLVEILRRRQGASGSVDLGFEMLRSNVEALRTISDYVQMLKTYNIIAEANNLAHSLDTDATHERVLPYTSDDRERLKRTERDTFGTLEFYSCTEPRDAVVSLDNFHVGSVIEYQTRVHKPDLYFDHINPEQSTIVGSRMDGRILGIYPSRCKLPRDRVEFVRERVPTYSQKAADGALFFASGLERAVFVAVCQHYNIQTPRRLNVQVPTYEIELFEAGQLVDVIDRRVSLETQLENLDQLDTDQRVNLVHQYHSWFVHQRRREEMMRGMNEVEIRDEEDFHNLVGDLVETVHQNNRYDDQVYEAIAEVLLDQARTSHHAASADDERQQHRQERQITELMMGNVDVGDDVVDDDDDLPPLPSPTAVYQPVPPSFSDHWTYIVSHTIPYQYRTRTGHSRESDHPSDDTNHLATMSRMVVDTLEPDIVARRRTTTTRVPAILYGHYTLAFELFLDEQFATFVSIKAQMLEAADAAYERTQDFIRGVFPDDVYNDVDLRSMRSQLPTLAFVDNTLVPPQHMLHQQFYDEFMACFRGSVRIQGLRREARVFNRHHHPAGMVQPEEGQLDARATEKLCAEQAVPSSANNTRCAEYIGMVNDEEAVTTTTTTTTTSSAQTQAGATYRQQKTTDHQQLIAQYTSAVNELSNRVRTELEELDRQVDPARRQALIRIGRALHTYATKLREAQHPFELQFLERHRPRRSSVQRDPTTPRSKVWESSTLVEYSPPSAIGIQPSIVRTPPSTIRTPPSTMRTPPSAIPTSYQYALSPEISNDDIDDRFIQRPPRVDPNRGLSGMFTDTNDSDDDDEYDDGGSPIIYNGNAFYDSDGQPVDWTYPSSPGSMGEDTPGFAGSPMPDF